MVRKVTVFEFERGLRYVKGRFQQVLEPGRYWLWTRSTVVQKVDVRPKFATVPGQDVLSADGVTIRVSLAATYKISDVVAAINSVEHYHLALYQSLQLALRELIGGTEIDDLLAARNTLGPRVLELCSEDLQSYGIELLAVDLKDIMFPGDLKRTFAQVVNARKEGQAALEKARGETAALRNLANAAGLMRDNPMLLQIRLMQQIGSSSGNTVVVGFPPGVMPVPGKAQSDGDRIQSGPESLES